MLSWRIVFVLVVAIAVSAFAHDAPNPATQPDAGAASALRIRIAVPEPDVPPLRGDQPNLHVVLENVSATPQRVFDEWNSAGYFNLTLDYTLPDGTHQQMRKNGSGVSWSKNNLSSTALQPGQCLVLDVYFDAKWNGVPKLSKQATLTFTATFTEENKFPGVWRGTIHSPPMQVVVKADH